MFSPKKKSLGSCGLACLFVLGALLVTWTSRGNVQAEAIDLPAFQETDSYPYPGDEDYTPEPTYTDSPDDNYPFPSDETPVDETPETETPDSETPDAETPLPGPTFSGTRTPAGAATQTRLPPLQATLTEVTEGITQVPPSPVQTSDAGPTQIVKTTTGTVTAEVTATGYRVLLTPSPSTTKGGPGLDWGLFWIGFSVPVLAAGGGVLYLLDRQPGFFSKRTKK